MFTNINTILFDLDGTLVDSSFVWHQIDIDFMNERGLDYSADAYQKEIEGKSMRETAVHTIERFNLQNEYTVDTLVDHWNEMAFDMYKDKVMLKPGAKEFLKYLHENGFKTSICSSNSYFLVETVLKARGIDKYINTIFTCNEVGRGKPAPDVYLAAADKLESTPAQCMVFEDVIPGIMAGKAAEMTTVAMWDDASAYCWDEKVELANYNYKDYFEILEVLKNA